MRVLICGWASFRHGEATAGDVAALRYVGSDLTAAGIPCETVWSPVFAPQQRHFDQVDPQRFSHVVFACGPAHGWQVRELHRRFARCRRIALGVSVIDPHDPAVLGFDTVLARDGTGGPPARDLAAHLRAGPDPVVGVALAPGQPEYGSYRRHEHVHRQLLDWLTSLPCAPLPVETRLDTRDGLLCSTPEQCAALFARTDAVITTRLHGLVLALAQGVPALAVDPVSGGGKVAAQARAWGWPGILLADDVGPEELDERWAWVRGEHARRLARERAGTATDPVTRPREVLAREQPTPEPR